MVNLTALEDALSEIEKGESPINNVLVVSRSGMHIAGTIPGIAHPETFVAMSAIILGASETASSELKDNMDHILIDLEGSKIIISQITPRSLLVFNTNGDTSAGQVKDLIPPIREKLKEFL